MRPLLVTENEKENILKLHNSKPIVEQFETGKTIADIQRLVGAKDDNYLGPETLKKIQSKLSLPDVKKTDNTIYKSTTPTQHQQDRTLSQNVEISPTNSSSNLSWSNPQ